MILSCKACPELTFPCYSLSHMLVPTHLPHWAPCSSSQVLSITLPQDICTVSLAKRPSSRYYLHFTQGSAQIPPLLSGLPGNNYLHLETSCSYTGHPLSLFYLHSIYPYLMYHKSICSLIYCFPSHENISSIRAGTCFVQCRIMSEM